MLVEAMLLFSPGVHRGGRSGGVPLATLTVTPPLSPDHAGITQRDIVDQFQEKMALTLKSYMDQQHPMPEGRYVPGGGGDTTTVPTPRGRSPNASPPPTRPQVCLREAAAAADGAADAEGGQLAADAAHRRPVLHDAAALRDHQLTSPPRLPPHTTGTSKAPLFFQAPRVPVPREGAEGRGAGAPRPTQRSLLSPGVLTATTRCHTASPSRQGPGPPSAGSPGVPAAAP